MPAEVLLSLNAVAKRFSRDIDMAERLLGLVGRPIDRRTVHAVDGVSLDIRKGEVLGLVGESGCGKSTLGRIVAGVHTASEGEIVYDGRPVAAMSAAERRQMILDIQMIFQDPYASLNPRKRVEAIVGEAPRIHGLTRGRKVADLVEQVLTEVGLPPAYRDRYPHQFSGGQRQRVGIARALAVEPKVLVCDESVAALDVSIQAQIINLFVRLKRDRGLTLLFISHDLGVVRHISDRVAIMYLGRIVELADTRTVFAAPHHPYTRALLEDVPRLDRRHRKFQPLKGEVPSPIDPPSGCHFHPRCPHAAERCRTEAPTLRPVGSDGHASACHFDIGHPAS